MVPVVLPVSGTVFSCNARGNKCPARNQLGRQTNNTLTIQAQSRRKTGNAQAI